MVDALIDTFGPFVIPVVLFFGGIVAYGLLALTQRYWRQRTE